MSKEWRQQPSPPGQQLVFQGYTAPGHGSSSLVIAVHPAKEHPFSSQENPPAENEGSSLPHQQVALRGYTAPGHGGSSQLVIAVGSFVFYDRAKSTAESKGKPLPPEVSKYSDLSNLVCKQAPLNTGHVSPKGLCFIPLARAAVSLFKDGGASFTSLQTDALITLRTEMQGSPSGPPS